MKLSAYIVRVDSGFAPNPFGRRCTLACCKPAVRRNAEPGDIIVGTGSAASGLADHLVYAMRVGEVLTLQDYWDRFPSKRPTPRTPISRRGDAVWHLGSSGRWRGVRGALHDRRHRERDLSGLHALVASGFYYFGRDAIRVPLRFHSLLATTQGHKNTHDARLIDRFWSWLTTVAPRPGRIGLPLRFDDQGCRAQCVENENDDSCQ